MLKVLNALNVHNTQIRPPTVAVAPLPNRVTKTDSIASTGLKPGIEQLREELLVMEADK